MSRPWGSVVLAAGVWLAASACEAQGEWRLLEPGLEVGEFSPDGPAGPGEGLITILRVDPDHFELRLLSNETGEASGNRSVARWMEEQGFTAAVNAGMFATDYVTHIGYMGCGGDRNNARVNAYLSAAAFGRIDPELPPFRIFDLDVTDFEDVRAGYSCIVQNLRLIKRSRENRWPQQGKKWSEVALAEDVTGKVLFIHCRRAYSMHDLNEILLSLPIGIVAAQHLEGGPEAQMVYRDGERNAELVGSFETGFFESADNATGWAIPNVLGIRRREP